MEERIETGLILLGFLGTAGLSVSLGLRWCRGRYLDAAYFEELNERWSARWLSLVGWRARTTRVPVVVEHEHSGWRTWQRLVWQERHRESLHTGVLVIVCAVGVMLAVYNLGDNTSMTFAVIPLIALLPCGMGLLGFRFDAGGQQLRFLANRGTSPAMIWLAKQVVWLPRAFWIPAVCWGVACFAEWAIVPWNGVDWTSRYTAGDPVRHPLFTQSFYERRFLADVFWFALMSYAVGQAAAMLFRRMILAAGAGLMATILFAGWQAGAVVPNELPRWWAVGGIPIWLLWLTGWYSRHWLIERHSAVVVKRLAVGLILPPIMLLFGAAVYRWLEVPGFGPSSQVLMAILYRQEFERRSSHAGPDRVNEIRAAIARASQPTSPEWHAIQTRLASANGSFQLLSQIRLSPEFITSLPFDVSREDFERAAAERFWLVNADSLATFLDVLSEDLPASYSTVKSYEPYEAIVAKPQLLLDAGRLSLQRGEAKEALRYFVVALRLGRCITSQGARESWHWCAGREQQAEALQSLVAWSNHESVTRELLLTSIQQTRDELARFPTLQEASVAEFVHGEESLRLAMEREESFMMRVAQRAVAVLLQHEFARRTREQELLLYWRWHVYGELDATMRWNQMTILQSQTLLQDSLTRSGPLNDSWQYSIFFSGGVRSRFGGASVSQIAGYEAVNRVTLLALAIALWKKDHDGHLPDSLEDLAVYCQIEGRNDPDRVLPSLTLNDPWTGGMFGYSAASRNLAEADLDQPVVILSSAGPDAFGQSHNSNGAVKGSVQSVTDKGVQYALRPSIGHALQIVLMQSHDGQLSLVLPPSPQRHTSRGGN